MRAASLQQRAWILRMAAVELHVADPAVPGHRASILALLRALFRAPEEPIEGGAGQSEGAGRRNL